jgi:GNAT superfamily N-acetyltransferase
MTNVNTPPRFAPAWTLASAPVDSGDAAVLLRLYFTDIVSRYYNRPASSAEVDAVMGEDPSGGLAPPSGLFLLARLDGSPAGCVGLRVLSSDIAEIKRMFVRPEARGRGGGSQLLRAVEEAARELGATSTRLDTRHDLIEARSLYARHGYVEIPPYNENPHTDHWFEKRLI